jgi:hypothetical protein
MFRTLFPILMWLRAEMPLLGQIKCANVYLGIALENLDILFAEHEEP